MLERALRSSEWTSQGSKGREEVWTGAGGMGALGGPGAPLPLAPWRSLSKAQEFRSNPVEVRLGRDLELGAIATWRV